MASRRLRVALIAGASAAVVAAGLLTATVAQAATACRVTYAVTNQWQGGFGASVTINNLGDPVDGWRLAWSYSAGQAVTQMWNATYTQAGSQVTATNVGYNGSLPTNGSATFGFNGTSNATNPAPSAFTLNGVACTGEPGTTPTSSGNTPGPGTTTQAPPPPPPPPPPPAGSCGSGSFNAEVTGSGTYVARNGTRQVYSGGNYLQAMQAAVDSLTAGRSSKQSVVVRSSGSISAGSRLSLASNTILDVCGTINVTGSGTGDMAPVYARGASNIDVRYLRLTGVPRYGIFMRDVNNLTLGQIDMRLSSGLGVRIDNHGTSNRANKVRNIRIDNVFVSGSSSHAVETYGVDGITIGTVTARNVGESGLLLNDTVNATVGTVDAQNAGAGTGYAAFRMANRNGRIGSSYPVNIRVGNVIASGGGRGIFCVSESGGAVVDRFTISNTGNNSVLLENCHNVTLAGQSGTITGGGEVRIAARTEFAASSNNTFQNMTVSGTNIRLSPCGTNNVIRNVTRVNSTLTWC
ncbi:MAG TPA: cellulose-binding domain-containing protein [Pilimelia sp.]|nr:cellulose-binding domain-containing protein [Pilimelia sp.]